MFENLKNTSSKKKNKELVENLFFKLFSNEKGYYIKVVDEEDRELTDLNTDNLDKLSREIIKALDNIREGNNFTISWGDDLSSVYLNEHPFLLDLLKKSDITV